MKSSASCLVTALMRLTCKSKGKRDGADLVGVCHAVILFRVGKQLGAEGCCDELCILGHLVNHLCQINDPDITDITCDGNTVGGVECLVDFVEEVERRRIAALNGENERKRLEI